MTHKNDAHIEWSSNPAGATAFARSQLHWLVDRQKELRAQFMTEENALRYQHGSKIVHPADDDNEPTNMQQHSAVTQLRFDDILSNNMDAWAKELVEMSDAMHGSFMGMVFKTVSDVSDKTGNVISAKEAGSFAQAFMEMMKKIELSVDRDGNVSMPNLYVPPGVAEKQIAELEAQPPEFHEEFKRIQQLKIDEAKKREAERKSKFKSADS
tara:strand:+ start:3717 stop:4349 length:633 start_codon:yes stop_codon:yes gene_type:complete